MKKFERALSIFFITSVPCFVLAVVFFLLIKEEVVFSIIAFAFSLFLVYVCSLLRRESALHTRIISLERDKETAYKEQELLNSCIEELQERVDRLEARIVKHESIISFLNKKQKESGLICNTKEETLNVPQNSETEAKTEGFSVSYNLVELEGKKELTSEDQFTIMRNGCGVMVLMNFNLLMPNAFESGKYFTSDMYAQWQSYSMEKLFNSSSRDMIGYKIVEIVPAKIQILGDKNGNSFKGVLMEKGWIELKKHV